MLSTIHIRYVPFLTGYAIMWCIPMSEVVGGAMVVTAAVDTTQSVRGGLRPMDPARDLGTIADLIASAFADEIDDRGRAALREMRWMARLSPLVWWWAHADPSFSDTFNGFVWEEPAPEGHGLQIIANVSLSRAPGSRRRWIICNVVVENAHRGQGIGRQLVEAAIDEAVQLGAEGILLQAYRDNAPALQLYTSLGFREVSGETGFRQDAVAPVALQDAPGYRLRPWRATDGLATYELARRIMPPGQRWIRPLRVEDYRPDWLVRLGRRISDLLAGRSVYRLVALHGDKLVAMMAVTAALRQGDHHLTLLTDPKHAGQVSAALVSRAVRMLSDLPSRAVEITLDSEQRVTEQVLRDYGFKEQRTLLTMRKDLD
jgi:ribosomal protein S18 acetylase RimI-like enzyme